MSDIKSPSQAPDEAGAPGRIVIANGLVHAMSGAPPRLANVVIDNGIVEHIGDGDGDVGVSGPNIVVDAEGAVVAPALTDIHTHIYWGATSLGVRPEEVAFRSGTGVFVDAGSAGAANIEGLRTFIFEPSPLHTFAYLNVAFPGIFGFSRRVMVGEGEDIRLLDKTSCLEAADRFRDIVVGIKVRAGRRAAGRNGGRALDLALEVAEAAGLPLMCHVDLDPPDIDVALDALRPGDILTHCCRPEPNAPVIGGDVRQTAWKARERGVVFDIGHGMGGFSFETCRQMVAEGFTPDLISSDIHCMSVDGPAHDVLTTLNKIVAVGVEFEAALAATTERPATVIGQPQLGRIRVGEPANIAVLRRQPEPAKLVDVTGESLRLEGAFGCQQLILNGALIATPQDLLSMH